MRSPLLSVIFLTLSASAGAAQQLRLPSTSTVPPILLPRQDAPAVQVIELSASARVASDRPDIAEGSTVSNGTATLEVGARLNGRRLAVSLSLESSLVFEWFDPQAVGEALRRGEKISRADMQFTPPGPRKLLLGVQLGL